MQKSADAAATSAQAGQTSLALNRRALILGNQPNVVVLNTRLTQPLAVGTLPEVNTQIVNLGKGVASRLENRGWIFLSEKREFNYTPIDPPPSVTDLLPGINVLNLVLKPPFRLTAAMLAALESKTLVLYVY